MFACMRACMYVCAFVQVGRYGRICIHLCMCDFCMYICMYICMYTCVYVCFCVFMRYYENGE